MSKGSMIVTILVAFVAGFMIGNIAGSTGSGGKGDEHVAIAEAAAGAEVDGPERFKVPVTGAQPSRGTKDALITITEFSDYQCPFCKRVEPTMTQLEKEYAGKLRIVWRDNPLPFHKDAEPAAEAALEARAQGGDAKFWQMHKLLFDNQQALTRADLDKYAQQIGLDMGKFKRALDTHSHKARINADKQLAAKVGARGTPAFFINGRFLSGAQPIQNFKNIIDDELKRAERLVKKGVSKAKLYATLTKNAKTEAAPPAPARQQARRQPDPRAVYKVPVGSSAQKGPKDALVTIVEFSDFQCPFCSRVGPTLAQIEKEYGSQVRVVFKHNPLPFHKEAGPAAQAAIEAQKQGKFWEMHDKLFENQRALTRADLDKYAKELGLNMARFKKALDSNKYQAVIDEDQKLARSLGASGTPSFFINGRSLRGAQPFPSFKTLIDEELNKAKALARSVPKGQLYAKIIAQGATAPKYIDAPAPSPGAAPAPAPDKVYAIPVPTNAPRKGSRKAKVVIQEFSDFQCPFCSRVLPTMKQVMDQYGDKVALVWRNYPLPFHNEAMPAAQAALEVFAQGGVKKFWAYHDLLFANQRALSRADLRKYAQQVGGIDLARFKKALDANKHKKAVEADMEAVRKAGAQIGTPSFFINGRLLQGAQPFQAFKAAVDRALEES
ncbi:MAG: thioredoxin domain-containing protein [Proteobacteria bacterium]|nr:thioredoxin domain-containing protein [Pseudomonadota bacterium]